MTEREFHRAGLRAVYSLNDLEPYPEVCMREARLPLSQAARTVADDWLPLGGAPETST